MKNKYIFILLLLSNSLFSQSLAERKELLKASDYNQIEVLKKYYFDYTENQKKLINDYLSLHRNENINHFSLQRIIDGIPIFYAEDNVNSVSSIRATTTVTPPSGLLSATAKSRATRSVGPPAANGTTSVMVLSLSGKSCATAVPIAVRANAVAAMVAVKRLKSISTPGCGAQL